MYAVVILSDDMDYEVTAFESHADALSMFNHWEETIASYCVRSVSLYTVPDAASPREVVEVIEAGNKERATLLRLKKSPNA